MAKVAPDGADEKFRVDKWLWAARFCKTRSVAADEIGKGRVRINGAACKPAREVRIGDVLRIERDGLVWEVEVLGLAQSRGPASIAQGLYRETAAGQQARQAEIERRRLVREPATQLHGRPTKRDRRKIEQLRET